MPIFEFVCTECNDQFDELLRNAEAIAGVTCPQCGSPQVRRKLSTVAARVSGRLSVGAVSSSSCGSSGST